MDTLKLSNGGYVFKWTMENFCCLPKKYGEVVESPCFTMETINPSLWKLNLVINATGKPDIVLKRKEDLGPVDLNINFLVLEGGNCKLNELFHEYITADSRTNCFAFPIFHFAQFERLLIKKDLTLIFHFWIPESKDIPRVIFISARSYIEVNMLKDQFKVHSFSSRNPQKRVIHDLPSNWVASYPLKLMICMPSEDCTVRDCYISLYKNGALKRNANLHLKVVFANTANETIATTQKSCIFPDAAPLEFPTMTAETLKPLRQFLIDDVLVVKLDFSISTGYVFSFIEGSEVFEKITPKNCEDAHCIIST